MIAPIDQRQARKEAERASAYLGAALANTKRAKDALWRIVPEGAQADGFAWAKARERVREVERRLTQARRLLEFAPLVVSREARSRALEAGSMLDTARALVPADFPVEGEQAIRYCAEASRRLRSVRTPDTEAA